ncbi:MAG: hypothetical protein OHK0039_13760 [Bacteroidia bacterium]
MSTFLERIQQDTIQDFIIDIRGYAGETTIEVRAEHILAVIRTLKEKFAFNYLADITASDHYTDQGRFEVSYNLVNMSDRQRLRVCCRIEEDQPEVDSIVEVYTAANWYEREAFDMMGITFRNHPDLRRIYMPEDYEWFPMRKEFPMLGIPGSIPFPDKDAPKEYK